LIWEKVRGLLFLFRDEGVLDRGISKGALRFIFFSDFNEEDQFP